MDTIIAITHSTAFEMVKAKAAEQATEAVVNDPAKKRHTAAFKKPASNKSNKQAPASECYLNDGSAYYLDRDQLEVSKICSRAMITAVKLP